MIELLEIELKIKDLQKMLVTMSMSDEIDHDNFQNLINSLQQARDQKNRILKESKIIFRK